MPGSPREAQLALSNTAHRYRIVKDGDGAAACQSQTGGHYVLG